MPALADQGPDPEQGHPDRHDGEPDHDGLEQIRLHPRENAPAVDDRKAGFDAEAHDADDPEREKNRVRLTASAPHVSTNGVSGNGGGIIAGDASAIAPLSRTRRLM